MHLENEIVCLWLTANRQIEILDLEDLEKECILARVRLALAQHEPSAVAVAGGDAAVCQFQQHTGGPR